MRVWEVTTGRELGQFAGHAEDVGRLAISPDGVHAVSSSAGEWRDGKYGAAEFTIRLWEVETKKEIRIFSGHT